MSHLLKCVRHSNLTIMNLLQILYIFLIFYQLDKLEGIFIPFH